MDFHRTFTTAATFSFILLNLTFQCVATEKKILHIVYLGKKNVEDPINHHVMLSNLIGSVEEARDALVYSYFNSFSGFAAHLTSREATNLAENPNVVSIFQSTIRRLHTTRSWDYLGVAFPSMTSLTTGVDVIIGVLDTGIWPEASSFDDHLLGPIPSKWKGSCAITIDFNSSACNRKLIGARYYYKGYEKEKGIIPGFKSPRDAHGHGTHTTSTAGGGMVEGANFFGLASGIARGGAPTARIAAYKVCWGRDCSDADILAAIDDAIADGVDILSVSLGGGPMEYFKDVLAIGAFHAMQNNILTCVSVGNDGPYKKTAANLAPWLLTVAASSMDREFITNIKLGNGLIKQGVALNRFHSKKQWHVLQYGGNVSHHSETNASKKIWCDETTLTKEKVGGKIVLCDDWSDFSDKTIAEAGGSGLIIETRDEYDPKLAYAYALPASNVNRNVADSIHNYMQSSRFPVAKILPAMTVLRNHSGPALASFSSRGPNAVTPDILKPDITAPGVDILAAWSPAGHIPGIMRNQQNVKFNIISGTSMACPHISGAAAHLKSLYPMWTPAALKSALMTTASALDRKNKKNKDGALGYGSGQVNPYAAANPGLIYDIRPQDYNIFLCSIGYNRTQLQRLTNISIDCSGNHKAWDLNYPSITIGNVTTSVVDVTIRRKVTNVGVSPSSYNAIIEHPKGVKVSVWPRELMFSSKHSSRVYKVRLVAKHLIERKSVEGSLAWANGDGYLVRIPIVITRT